MSALYEDKIDMLLSSVNDIEVYLNMLNEYKNDYLILLAVRDTPGNMIPETHLDLIREIGFQSFSKELWRMYVGAVLNGKRIIDTVAGKPEENIHIEAKIGDLSILLESLAWRTGNRCSICISGTDYSANTRGVNIVVYDLVNNKVVDSIGYDSHDDQSTFALSRRELTLKGILKQKLLHSEIALWGNEDSAKQIIDKFGDTLNIKKIITGKREELTNPVIRDKGTELYRHGMLTNEFVVICRSRDDEYYGALDQLEKDGFILGGKCIRYDVCMAILSDQIICSFLGYCQILGVMQIMKSSKTFTKQYFLKHYHINSDVKPHQRGFRDFVFGMKIADILFQIPLSSMFSEKDIEYDFEKDLSASCRRIFVPQLLFKGFYPYAGSKLREYNIESELWGHIDYPYLYRNELLDRLTNEGKSNEEILKLITDENFYTKKEVTHAFRVGMKFIEQQDHNSDVSMYDYIKDNILKKRLWRDGLHYESPLFFELARRVLNYLGVSTYVIEEINAYEEQCEKNNVKFQIASEFPILPSVEKYLEIEFEHWEDAVYELKITPDGRCRYVNFKEWVCEYCDFIRSVHTIKKIRSL